MNECYFCLLRNDHGGKCEGKISTIPCLLFKRDPRGCRKYLENIKFDVPFGIDIPEIGEETTDWTMRGVAKTLTITNIRKVEWNTNAKGLHGVHFWADIWYWSDENGELPPERPKLKLVKSGGEQGVEKLSSRNRHQFTH
ncbi:hypothetical protein [Desulfosporosinus sp. FKA]|uniref:hypothetical protein n=1 Tax=Desulfosporosinus sp. FKA TaxID=1969834 RepID=UPI000B4A52DC|nr:hypothetical protein [Desulfosporosinus sp. FKA]